MFSSVFQLFIGERKTHLNNPPTRNSAFDIFFLIHLALLFRFVYVSLWNNIRSLKIFTRRVSVDWGVDICCDASPDALLLLDFIFLHHKLNKVCMCEFFTNTSGLLNPHKDEKWKISELFIFLVTQGFSLSAPPDSRQTCSPLPTSNSPIYCIEAEIY
jgi:hypothetical protein